VITEFFGMTRRAKTSTPWAHIQRNIDTLMANGSDVRRRQPRRGNAEANRFSVVSVVLRLLRAENLP
jgi:hypothetical protein